MGGDPAREAGDVTGRAGLKGSAWNGLSPFLALALALKPIVALPRLSDQANSRVYQGATLTWRAVVSVDRSVLP
jgi:hypothetical protein